jgi:hypothetical protein
LYIQAYAHSLRDQGRSIQAHIDAAWARCADWDCLQARHEIKIIYRCDGIKLHWIAVTWPIDVRPETRSVANSSPMSSRSIQRSPALASRRCDQELGGKLRQMLKGKTGSRSSRRDAYRPKDDGQLDDIENHVLITGGRARLLSCVPDKAVRNCRRMQIRICLLNQGQNLCDFLREGARQSRAAERDQNACGCAQSQKF